MRDYEIINMVVARRAAKNISAPSNISMSTLTPSRKAAVRAKRVTAVSKLASGGELSSVLSDELDGDYAESGMTPVRKEAVRAKRVTGSKKIISEIETTLNLGSRAAKYSSADLGSESNVQKENIKAAFKVKEVASSIDSTAAFKFEFKAKPLDMPEESPSDLKSTMDEVAPGSADIVASPFEFSHAAAAAENISEKELELEVPLTPRRSRRGIPKTEDDVLASGRLTPRTRLARKPFDYIKNEYIYMCFIND
jgi:hypothetical protein